ncbi:hypothetical protein CMK22_00770 [Candidatus Poribacteria bacterium]|nr:hypothetical protein [Candidatus Poribacteria bacterium]
MKEASDTYTMELMALSNTEVNFFADQGYLILPSFLSAEYCTRIVQDIDQLLEQRTGGYASRNSDENGTARIISFPDLGALTSHPSMIAKIRSLMGSDGFALHHQHANRHEEGTVASNWHHDYEQFPQTDRDQLMVHCFYYPAGLNGEIGDLLILPRSHRSVMDPNAFSDKFYTEDLPGSLTLDNLPPGSVVIVHSALMHARRAKLGGAENPRYFTDVSYCQAGPQKWPAYGFPLPKMWLHKQVCDRALSVGHGRNKEFDFIYNTSIFYDVDTSTEEQRVGMERVLKQRQVDVSVREKINHLT